MNASSKKSTKELLMENALHIFADKGYEGASMSEIANKTNIQKSTIYSYYRGKDDLYLAVLEHLSHFHQGYWKQVKEEQRTKPLKSTLHTILIDVYKTSTEAKKLSMVWQRALISPPENLTEQISLIMNRSKEIPLNYLRELFEAAIRYKEIHSSYDPYYLAHAYYCLLEGVTLTHVYDSIDNNEKLINVLFDTFWRGLSSKF